MSYVFPMNPFRRQCFHEGGYRLVGTLDLNGPDGSPWPRPRRDTVRIILLKVVLPLAIIGASIIALTILQLNGTLQEFLDRQSMFGMLMVVLVLNIVGFAFIYMLIMVWNSIRHDLLRHRDP
jgi:hypothetical protein